MFSARLFVASITAGFIAVLGAFVSTHHSALACSGDPGDLIGDSATIIRGRITSWREIPSDAGPGAFRPIEVTIAVGTVYKGSSPSTISFVDRASYLVNGGQVFWTGAGGACGIFDFDPTGAEIIMPIRRGDDGAIQIGRLSVLYIGPQSDRRDQVDAMIRGRLGEPHPPSVGTGLQLRSDAAAYRLVALGLSLIALATIAEIARRLSGARSG